QLIARDPKLALAALSLRSNHAARHSATSPAPQQCRSGSTGDYFNRLLTDEYLDRAINRIVTFYSEPTKQNRPYSVSQNAGGATKTEKYNDEHRRLIAQKLIEYERQMLGSMRMKTNRLLIKYTLSALESVGIKKPLLKGADQHIYDTMVSNETALETLLRATLLIGNDRKGKYPCWSGRGKYVGWQGMLQRDDFTVANKERCVLVILLTSLEPLMATFLEPLPIGWDND
ncbi:MAG TPA: hypothetical protein VHY22_05415, partial [Chthoniobacteraceae bacterium]|nr:hypothetical protein [Chthoniobacteraceae bacterium]